MVCCHQCQRGRLLDNVVFDVTQMPYQSLDSVYRAQTISKEIYNVYRANSGIKGSWQKVSVNRALKVNEEKDSFHEPTQSSKKILKRLFPPSSLGCQRKCDKNSFHRVHSVITGNSVLTEFTRRLKDCHGVCSINQAQSVNKGIFFEQSSPCRVS